jgi:hypothetical protein
MRRVHDGYMNYCEGWLGTRLHVLANCRLSFILVNVLFAAQVVASRVRAIILRAAFHHPILREDRNPCT